MQIESLFEIHVRNDETPLDVDIETGGGGHFNLCPLTKLELHQALEPLTYEIYSEMEKRFSLRKITPIILKNMLLEIKEKPFQSACKVAALFICCYMLKNLALGIIGGEALFADFALTRGLFSSDQSTQNNSGGLLTNAAADVNFTIDSLFVGYGIYRLSLRPAYQKAACDIINDCFDKHISCAENGLSKEERSELYKLKNQELANYDRAPFNKIKIPSDPLRMEELKKNSSLEEISSDAEKTSSDSETAATDNP